MSLETDFVMFWARYPRHIGKLAAMKAYKKARQVASAEQILEGIASYLAAKPVYADYCHATTFLNQGRFLDEPDVRPEPWICPHTPRCPHRAACAIVAARTA